MTKKALASSCLQCLLLTEFAHAAAEPAVQPQDSLVELIVVICPKFLLDARQNRRQVLDLLLELRDESSIHLVLLQHGDQWLQLVHLVLKLL